MSDRRPLLLTSLALLVGVAVGAVSGRRAQATPPPPLSVIEYKLLAWERADMIAVLRKVTGDDVSSVREMVRKLGTGTIEPVDNPKLQRAVDARLQEKLAKVGVDGWEAFWIRKTTRVVQGHVLPAPAVLLKRRP